MINGTGIFTFLDTANGVNKDGEKYVALNVLTNEKRKRKINFIVKDENLMNKLLGMKFVDYQGLKLNFTIDRLYNNDKKTSYWNVQLIGIGN